jgi:hypothetical protein
MPGQPPQTTAHPTLNGQTIVLARLGIVTGENDEVSSWVNVQFNPASLQLQVSNELKDTANNERKQYVAKSNAKLTMELQFDTTDTGTDVTEQTRRLQAFISPPLPAGEEARTNLPPPIVLFEWGRIRFQGIAESYRETIDFFSSNGVPLRAAVNLTLSRQDQVFDSPGSDVPSGADVNSALDTLPRSPAQAANDADAPDTSRAIGEANGQESLRFGDGSPLTLNAQAVLKPPAAFSSGGGSFGAGIGLNVSAGAGVGGAAFSASAGISVSAGASAGSAGVSVSAGISAVAGLSASEGAFDRLRPARQRGASMAQLNLGRLTARPGSATLPVNRAATIGAAGRAIASGGAGLNADVGAGAQEIGKLIFDR